MWRGLNLREHTEVALKAIPVAARGEGATEFEREVRDRVEHPFILPIFDQYVEGEYAWLVMPLAAGSLADALRHIGRFERPLALRVVLNLCGALAAVDDAGMVHRDVKPGNVMVMADGGVRLTDFGIVHVRRSGCTRTGTAVGTPEYMAPEQRSPPYKVRPATDVYALAMLLAELRTGERPGDVFVAKVAQALRARLREVGETDDSLADLVIAAMAHDPLERTATAFLFAEGLLRLAGPVAEDTRGLLGLFEPLGHVSSGLISPVAPSLASKFTAPQPPWTPASFVWVVGGATLAFAGGVGANRVSSWLEVGVAGIPSEWGPVERCADPWASLTDQRVMGPRESVGASAQDLDNDGHVDVVFASQHLHLLGNGGSGARRGRDMASRSGEHRDRPGRSQWRWSRGSARS